MGGVSIKGRGHTVSFNTALLRRGVLPPAQCNENILMMATAAQTDDQGGKKEVGQWRLTVKACWAATQITASQSDDVRFVQTSRDSQNSTEEACSQPS